MRGDADHVDDRPGTVVRSPRGRSRASPAGMLMAYVWALPDANDAGRRPAWRSTTRATPARQLGLAGRVEVALQDQVRPGPGDPAPPGRAAARGCWPRGPTRPGRRSIGDARAAEGRDTRVGRPAAPAPPSPTGDRVMPARKNRAWWIDRARLSGPELDGRHVLSLSSAAGRRTPGTRPVAGCRRPATWNGSVHLHDQVRRPQLPARW